MSVTHFPSVAVAPQLTPGTELVGPYQDSGLIEPTFLVRTTDGQMIQLSSLLFTVLSFVDGTRSTADIASRVGNQIDRTVSTGNIEYLLHNKLAPIGLIATDESATKPQEHDKPSDILVLKARRTILKERWVFPVSRAFTPFFQPFVVLLVLCALIGGDIWLITMTSIQTSLLSALSSSSAMMIAMALSIASMLFHELGHASACRYGGATPGKIGCGIYIVWPAFYTDVTDSYRLNRRGRLRVDLGGVYFNAIFALGLLIIAIFGDFPTSAVAVLALLLIHIEIMQQLLPSLRFDGHLILADLVGIPDLFSRIGPVLKSVLRRDHTAVQDMKRSSRIIVSLWVIGTVIFLTYEIVFLAIYGPELASTFAKTLYETANELITSARHTDVAGVGIGVLATVTLLLPVVGLCYVLTATLRQLTQLLVRKMHRSQSLPTSKQGALP